MAIKEDLLKRVLVEQQIFLRSPGELWNREYQPGIAVSLENDLIVFLTGVRRAGKSYLLKIVQETASRQKGLEDRNFLYINFEDERLANIEPNDLSGIIELYFRLFTPDFDKKMVLLFDEIQNISLWHRWINRLFEQKRFKIFITGSNASIIKQEIGRVLTGRSIAIEIFPLSFREYLYYFKNEPPVTEKDFYDVRKRAVIMNAFENYLQAGGFPEYLKTGNYQVLQEYFKDIIHKDIIYRYSIRYKKELKEIAKIIISEPGNVLSLKNIASAVGLKNIGTVKNYIEYLQESYLVFGIPLFSPSLKKQIYNPNKYYGIDPGLYRSVSFGLTDNNGPLLENIVFLELKRRLKGVDELFYYKTRTGKEIDFLVTARGKTRLFQVCYDLGDEATLQREIRASVEAAKELGLREATILNRNLKDTIERDGITISIIPIWEFLLQSDS